MLISLLFGAIITWAFFDKIVITRQKHLFAFLTANGFKRLPLRCQKTGHIWISALSFSALTLSSRADQFDDLRLYWQNNLINSGGSISSIQATQIITRTAWKPAPRAPSYGAICLWFIGSVVRHCFDFPTIAGDGAGMGHARQSHLWQSSLASAVINGLDWMNANVYTTTRDRI